MIDLLRLRYFYSVARHGSFTKASQSLRISQPTLSKMIKDLESDHGVRLLDRGKRGVTLTAAGEIALRSCETIFDECANLERAIEGSHHETAGMLAFGAVDSLSHYILPTLIAEAARRFPQIRFNLITETSSRLRQEVLDGGIEFALCHTTVPQDHFITERLGTSRFAIAYRTGLLDPNLFAKGKRLPDGVCFIGPRAADYRGTRQHRSLVDTLEMDPERIIEVTTQEMQKRLMVAGMGFSILPHYMILDEVRRGRTLTRPAMVFANLLRERLPDLLRID